VQTTLEFWVPEEYVSDFFEPYRDLQKLRVRVDEEKVFRSSVYTFAALAKLRKDLYDAVRGRPVYLASVEKESGELKSYAKVYITTLSALDYVLTAHAALTLKRRRLRKVLERFRKLETKLWSREACGKFSSYLRDEIYGRFKLSEVELKVVMHKEVRGILTFEETREFLPVSLGYTVALSNFFAEWDGTKDPLRSELVEFVDEAVSVLESLVDEAERRFEPYVKEGEVVEVLKEQGLTPIEYASLPVELKLKALEWERKGWVVFDGVRYRWKGHGSADVGEIRKTI